MCDNWKEMYEKYSKVDLIQKYEIGQDITIGTQVMQ